MKKKFLDFLCCPICNSDLDLNSYEISNEKVKTGKLVCKSQRCNQVYKIKNFIPRFVDSPKYADSFGKQWNLFAKTQLDNNRQNLLIAEVEHIWREIDQNDNWELLYEKINNIRKLGYLLGSEKLVYL